MAWGRRDEPDPAQAAAEQARQAALQAQQQTRQAAHQAQQPAADAEAQRQAYLASPVGLAETARQRGDKFFQIDLNVSELVGPKSSFGSSTNRITRKGHADLLGQIEDLGWRLEHVGYVFIESGSTSTNRFLVTGQGTVTRGVVRGIYLFRAVETPGGAEP